MSKDSNDKQTIDGFSPLMEPAQIKALIKVRGWNQMPDCKIKNSSDSNG